jgi:hypothetical protein
MNVGKKRYGVRDNGKKNEERKEREKKKKK